MNTDTGFTVKFNEHGEFDYVAHVDLQQINKKMISADTEQKASIAFAIAAEILHAAYPDLDISSDEFTLDPNGDRVCFRDHNSWGDNGENSKTRIKSGRPDVIDVEFYLRHALLAVEHWSYGRKLVPSSDSAGALTLR